MKKTLIIAALLLVAVAASAQDIASSWQIGLAAGWNGVAYHSGIYPNLTVEGHYLLPYGIHASLQTTAFHRRMPSDNSYNAFSLSLRANVHIKALLGQADPRWDFYAGTGIGYHHFRHTTFADGVGQVFVPVYVGTEWRFAPHWHLALELAYNDASTLRLRISLRL